MSLGDRVRAPLAAAPASAQANYGQRPGFSSFFFPFLLSSSPFLDGSLGLPGGAVPCEG